jgi:hypothetical protein
VLSPRAQDGARQPAFGPVGLAANELPMLGVPTVTGPIFGITADELYPERITLEGDLKADNASLQSKSFLDVLGIRYVLAVTGEPVMKGLPEVRSYPAGLDLYENSGAWPPAFFVSSIPTAPVPRLAGCSHDRFLCADFSKYEMHRLDQPLRVVRDDDGFRLTLPYSNSARDIVITEWFRDGWKVTQGRASLVRAAEQLIGVHVAPGETSVTLRYRPVFRAVLFGVGIVTELAVVIGLLMLLAAARRAPRVTLATSPVGSPTR